MSLSSCTFGKFQLYTIETGYFRLDGGAMFGVVPKPLWSRFIEADELNRIPMTMRCLLVKSEESGRLYLIDNGIGSKGDAKFQKIYDLDLTSHNLEKSLAYHGFTKDDITDVVFTHLHFDHCGGSTFLNDEGVPELDFKNAQFWVGKKQWINATNPNQREKASYFPENIQPLATSGKLHLVDENHSYEDGFGSMEVNGHSLGQQLPIFEADGRMLVFAADLIPTHAHIPLAWVMGYDMQPLLTLDEKEQFLNRAAEENWFLYLEHDRNVEMVSVVRDGKKFKVGQKSTLNLF